MVQKARVLSLSLSLCRTVLLFFLGCFLLIVCVDKLRGLIAWIEWYGIHCMAGLGLDVTMKESYGGGVGDVGLNTPPPSDRTATSESTLRDFPMTFEPLVNMPAPNAMTTASMVRAHTYNVLCLTGTALFNYYVMNNDNFLTLANNRAVDVIAAEMQELLPGLLSTRHISTVSTATAEGNSPSVQPDVRGGSGDTPIAPFIISAATVAPSATGIPLSASVWVEEPYKTRTGVNTSYVCIRIVIVNGAATPVAAQLVIDGVAAAGLEDRPVTRIFGAVYDLNFAPFARNSSVRDDGEGSHTGGGGGRRLVSLTDMIDGWGANVYQIGCEVLPSSNKNNIAVNGNFEDVEITLPTEFGRSSGRGGDVWHVYAPDGQ